MWPLGLSSQHCNKQAKIGLWLCVLYCENEVSSATMLSHWAANALSPLMSDERLLKNMPAKITYSHVHPSLLARVTNKPEIGRNAG